LLKIIFQIIFSFDDHIDNVLKLLNKTFAFSQTIPSLWIRKQRH